MIVLRVVVEQVDKNLAAIAAQTKVPEYMEHKNKWDYDDMEQMRISGMMMTWNKWAEKNWAVCIHPRAAGTGCMGAQYNLIDKPACTAMAENPMSVLLGKP